MTTTTRTATDRKCTRCAGSGIYDVRVVGVLADQGVDFALIVSSALAA